MNAMDSRCIVQQYYDYTIFHSGILHTKRFEKAYLQICGSRVNQK